MRMVADMGQTFRKDHMIYVKAALDFMPDVLGDGKKPGSMILKYIDAEAMKMPLRDGEWFLLKLSQGRHVGCQGSQDSHSTKKAVS